MPFSPQQAEIDTWWLGDDFRGPGHPNFPERVGGGEVRLVHPPAFIRATRRILELVCSGSTLRRLFDAPIQDALVRFDALRSNGRNAKAWLVLAHAWCIALMNVGFFRFLCLLMRWFTD